MIDPHLNAVLEAMAAGVAVVATDIPGHRELIESDRTGRLVPLGDRGELARGPRSAGRRPPRPRPRPRTGDHPPRCEA